MVDAGRLGALLERTAVELAELRLLADMPTAALLENRLAVNPAEQ
jgi:hypothetical protein